MRVRPGSLRRHFLFWLGLGALGCALSGAAAAWWHAYGVLARAQDARLSAAVHAAPGSATSWRITSADGDWQGQGGLPAHPWPERLRPGDAPSMHTIQAEGSVVRVAAIARASGAASVHVVQVAEPLALRMPGWQVLAAGWLPAFGLGVGLMAALAAVAALLARRWVQASLRNFQQADAIARAPEELRETLARVARLQHEQEQWVDEQRRFLADAAHQLRTPMAVLRTQLQSALAAPDDPRPVLGEMLHTVDRAAGLANQLLSLTRVQQLQRAGQLAPVAVGPAVREAVIELSPLIARKRLDFALDGGSFDAPADPVMLGELLRNLLANAIHHSPQEGRLGVVLRPAFHEIVVWDQGPGVADALKPRLFTPFTAARGGVGLGLSICQQIAEAMEAQVRLHNRVEAGQVAGVDAVVAWRATA